ncbi:MAG: hypothetical protein ACR2KU_14490 [Gammaproteobacteria bacterium]
MYVVHFQNRLVVAVGGLVVDLDQDVAVALLQHPVGHVIGGAQHRVIADEPVFLVLIEILQDHHHAVPVGGANDLAGTVQPRRLQRTIRLECGYIPRVPGRTVLERIAALHAKRESVETFVGVGIQRRDEFAGIALGVPLTRIGILPDIVSGFSSSKMAMAMRLFISRPSIRVPG